MNKAKTTRRARGPSALIFIVDDNAMLVEFAGAVLKAEGYDIKSFTDPKDVLRAMTEADPKPAALLTDYEMGEINGLELIVSSHKIHPKLKTVVVSGSIDKALFANHPAKVHRLLSKPYQPAQLKILVAELLQS
jgi:DNA-binding NtrC family response regulator